MSDCILWTGAKNQYGYGRVYAEGGKTAHKVAWEAVNGPVPAGMQLHHTCGVKACTNVVHLLLLTAAEHNALHPQSSRRTHCTRGHALDAANRLPNGRSPAGAQKWTCRRCKELRRGR